MSNRLIALHSGLRVSDSQCGLRIYPLQTSGLPTRASRYGFETEILVRCAWACVDVIESRANCVYEIPTGRVSHFKPWRDSFSAVAMHARLLSRSLSPVAPTQVDYVDADRTTGTIFQRLVQWFSPVRAWRLVRHDPRERRRFAAAVSVGVFVANLPVYGFQSVLSLVLARGLKLQPLAVLAGSNLSIPPIGPVLIACAIAVGHFLLHGTLASPGDFDPSRVGYLELIRRVAVEWTVGSIVCGLILSAATYLISDMILRYVTPAEPSFAEDKTLATHGVQ